MQHRTSNLDSVCAMSASLAIASGSGEIAPRHLLQAILRSPHSVGMAILSDVLGDRLDELVAYFPPVVVNDADGALPPSTAVSRVEERASNAATGWSHNFIGTEHLLVSLLEEPTILEIPAIKAAGLTSARVRVRTEYLLGCGPKGAAQPLPRRIWFGLASIGIALVATVVALAATCAK